MHRGAHRLSLLASVAGALRGLDCEFALVGAAALAVHGVTRSTRDLDLLTTDARCLAPATWTDVAPGVAVDIRAGDADDALAGITRVTRGEEPPVDVVVGRQAWQGDLVRRARPVTVAGVEVPVATRADLVLLKLYAGGAQDTWDIEQLLDAGDDLSVEIDRHLPALPDDARALWARLRRPR